MKIIAKNKVSIIEKNGNKIKIPNKYRIGNVWEIPDDLLKDGSTYQIEVDGVRYIDEKACKIIYDTNDNEYYAIKKSVTKLGTYKKLDIKNLSIYLLNIKGFTAHKTSSVKQAGTFLGAVKKIDYIKDMGFNAIELMPIYKFDEKLKNGKINYWGYTEGYYYALNDTYASSDEIKEFKTLVRECHKKDVAVIMQLYFQKELSTENMIDVIKFWKVHYGIDGFNISGNIKNINEVINSPYFTDTFIYSDWISDGYLADDSFLKKVRAFVRGDDDAAKNLIGHLTDDIRRINYAAYYNGFTLNDVVSYEKKHNEANGENNADGENYNYSMNFGIEGFSEDKDILDKRKKAIKNLLFLTFLARGIPRLYMGDESYRTQYGNNNMYYLDEDINYLQYLESTEVLELRNYIKELNKTSLKLRNNFKKKVDYLPSISIHQEDAWNSKMETTTRCFAIYFRGENEYIMLINMSSEKSKIGIANELGRKYTYIVGSTKNDIEINGKHIIVEPFSTSLYEIGE